MPRLRPGEGLYSTIARWGKSRLTGRKLNEIDGKGGAAAFAPGPDARSLCGGASLAAVMLGKGLEGQHAGVL